MSFAALAADGKSAGHRKGRGKQGGSRVIYFGLPLKTTSTYSPLYGKGVKDDLTPTERAAWRKAVEAIKKWLIETSSPRA